MISAAFGGQLLIVGPAASIDGHEFKRIARFDYVRGYAGPIDLWVCACGEERVVAKDDGPSGAPVAVDRSGQPTHAFQDYSQRGLPLVALALLTGDTLDG